MIAAPEGANDTHLQALAALSRLLIDPDFVAKLKQRRLLIKYSTFSQKLRHSKKPML